MIYVGIDLSVSSPGVCLINELNEIYMYYVSSKKKHENIISNRGNIRIRMMTSVFKKEWDNRINRWEEISSAVVELIDSSGGDEFKIGIEDYSYGSVGSGTTKLAELKGIVLYKLRKYDVREISPSVNKKFFTGSGNATKKHMYKQFVSMHPEINLFDIFDMEYKEGSEDVPCPIQDIIDGYSLALCTKGEKITNNNVVNNILIKLNKEK
jgi:Holliday junction resolvasome RuvABC endonuclease subunit